MERFVRVLVAGGTALVAGLWIALLGPVGPASGAVGGGLALMGVLALWAGIWMELEV